MATRKQAPKRHYGVPTKSTDRVVLTGDERSLGVSRHWRVQLALSAHGGGRDVSREGD